jgi:hypothetical protein
MASPDEVAAHDDRGTHCKREERGGERPQPRAPRPARTPGLALFTREVGDELVELGVGLRRHAAIEPCLELVGVQTPLDMGLPQNLRDRVALLVSDSQRALGLGLSCRLLGEMVGGDHSSVELTVSVKAPCQECGGRGYVETVTGRGRIVGDRTQECLTCRGKGLIPEDMPLSQFRELLASRVR